MFRYLVICAAFALAINSAVAKADEYPNLIGVWTESSSLGGARFGDGDHDTDEKNPVFISGSITWTLTIEKQDRAGLIGTWSSQNKTEKLVGVIRRDKVTLLFSDEDNQFEASLISENEMELCAHDSDDYALAACHIMKRQ